MTKIEVVSPGPLTTIQDLGRPGWAHIGVPPSGAADRPALRLANSLVGNDEGAAALETTLIGPKLRSHGATVVALTGAESRASIGARLIPMNTAVALGDGEVLNVGTARSGLRTYVAFAGGITGPMMLGSAATDVLTGVGPAPLARDDLLELGEVPQLGEAADPGPAREADDPGPMALPPAPPHPSAVPTQLQIALGPRDDWFTRAAVEILTAERFLVTPDSNRIGLRLDGPRLEHARERELLTEGLVAGAIQVPSSGRPILLLADHPTTGGYPVIATLLSRSLPLAAQLRPGQEIRFTTVAAAL